jgi:hypothetical protein
MMAGNSDTSPDPVTFLTTELSSLVHYSMAICMNWHQKCGICRWSPEKALNTHNVCNSRVDPEAVDMMTEPDLLNALVA